LCPRGSSSISSCIVTSEARRGRILAIVNQKGGVGKTTTAVNLTASLAAAERATLLVDIDPQANASSAYGVIAPQLQLYDALLDDCVISQITHTTELSHLHLVPSGPDLVGAEIELVTLEDREGRMRRALEPVAHAYDFIVIDCPPSLSPARHHRAHPAGVEPETRGRGHRAHDDGSAREPLPSGGERGAEALR
jgi:Mrp family chromosome partitioning ATPase